MRRLYIIIKNSKKILQKQVGLYYHSIIVFDEEITRIRTQESGLLCWKSLFKVRINVPLIKKFFQKAVDNSIGCVIIYSQTEHLFFMILLFLFWKSQEWFKWMLVVRVRVRVFLLSIVRILFAIANGYCLHPALKQKTSPLSFYYKEKLILVTWISFWFVRNANRKSVLSVPKNTQKCRHKCKFQ